MKSEKEMSSIDVSRTLFIEKSIAPNRSIDIVDSNEKAIAKKLLEMNRSVSANSGNSVRKA